MNLEIMCYVKWFENFINVDILDGIKKGSDKHLTLFFNDLVHYLRFSIHFLIRVSVSSGWLSSSRASPGKNPSLTALDSLNE